MAEHGVMIIPDWNSIDSPEPVDIILSILPDLLGSALHEEADLPEDFCFLLAGPIMGDICSPEGNDHRFIILRGEADARHVACGRLRFDVTSDNMLRCADSAEIIPGFL